MLASGQLSALSRLSWITAVDFVGLKIAQGGAQDRRTYASPRRALHQIADRVLAFGGSAIFHVDQYGRPIG